MRRTFIEFKEFQDKIFELGVTEDGVGMIQWQIMLDPKKHPVIPGTGGLRKMRYAIGNRGKSGGVRVLYVDFDKYAITYLITAYAKNEQDNISTSDRHKLRLLIEQLEINIKNNKHLNIGKGVFYE